MGRLERTSAQHPRAMDALEAQAGLRGVQTFMPPRAAGWQAKSRGGAACCQLPPGAWPGALSTSPCPRGHHLLGLGHASPLCPVGEGSFPRRWQVPYPLVVLVSSLSRCFCSPCCAPAALKVEDRRRPGGQLCAAPGRCFRGMPQRSRLPLLSHARHRCCGTRFSQQSQADKAATHSGTRRATRAGGGAEGRLGDLLHPPALGGRRAPSVPGLGPQLPRLRPPPTPPPPSPPDPGWRLPGSARRSPRGSGAGRGLRRRRAVPAVPNGCPRPGIKAAAAAAASSPPPAGPPGAAPRRRRHGPPPPAAAAAAPPAPGPPQHPPAAAAAPGRDRRRCRDPPRP